MVSTGEECVYIVGVVSTGVDLYVLCGICVRGIMCLCSLHGRGKVVYSLRAQSLVCTPEVVSML